MKLCDFSPDGFGNLPVFLNERGLSHPHSATNLALKATFFELKDGGHPLDIKEWDS